MLTQDEVQKIAKLAKLELTPEEITKYQKELSEFLDYAKKLDNIDTENVKPLYQVTGLKHIVRQDKIKQEPEELMEKIISASPQGKEDNQFLVKNIL